MGGTSPGRIALFMGDPCWADHPFNGGEVASPGIRDLMGELPPLKGGRPGPGCPGSPGSRIYHFRVAPAEKVDVLERQIAQRGFEWWSRELLGRSGRRD